MNVLELRNLGIKFTTPNNGRVSRRRIPHDNFNSDNFPLGRHKGQEDFWAFRNVSFSLKAGGYLGIIGKNGSGKSTLLRVIAGIYSPDEGDCTVLGRVGLLQVGLGFHNELSGRDNIYISSSILGLKKKEIDAVYKDIVEFSELGRFIDVPLKAYSSGMVARLGFATSINLKHDILLLDEVFAVGDESFREKCKDKLREIKEAGKTVIVVSHNMREVKTLCERTVVLEKGRVLFDGPSAEAVDLYVKRIAEKKQRGKALRELQ
ncbi:MAG TPA: ABC transporter ATP-binding protein [Thermodesulfovibrionales bacterium]|nr:ABC transporter ATP-binding protein [Thermodesulfovibrionales bacterium]